MKLKSIKVFSTPTCPYCVMAKDYLKENDIEFADLNVASDDAARDEMIEKSGQMGVPVIIVAMDNESGEVEENVIIGFDKEKIDSLISGKTSADGKSKR